MNAQFNINLFAAVGLWMASAAMVCDLIYHLAKDWNRWIGSAVVLGIFLFFVVAMACLYTAEVVKELNSTTP